MMDVFQGLKSARLMEITLAALVIAPDLSPIRVILNTSAINYCSLEEIMESDLVARKIDN